LKGDGQQMEPATRQDQPFQDIPGKPRDVTAVPTLRQHEGRQAGKQHSVLARSCKIQSHCTCPVNTSSICNDNNHHHHNRGICRLFSQPVRTC